MYKELHTKCTKSVKYLQSSVLLKFFLKAPDSSTSTNLRTSSLSISG